MRTMRALLVITGLLILVFSGQPSQASSPASTSLAISNPTCHQSISNTANCFINFRTLYATSDDSSFGHLEIAIDGKVRAYYSAFFETSISGYYTMLGDGLQVTCGLPNAGGDPKSGNIYPVEVSIFLGDASYLTDTANVTCPSYVSIIQLPLVRK
jgi:hypothetical protein